MMSWKMFPLFEGLTMIGTIISATTRVSIVNIPIIMVIINFTTAFLHSWGKQLLEILECPSSSNQILPGKKSSKLWIAAIVMIISRDEFSRVKHPGFIVRKTRILNFTLKGKMGLIITNSFQDA